MVGLTAEQRKANFDAMFQQLVAYHQQHGTANVPLSANTRLSRWVARQRHELQRRGTNYPKEQVDRLSQLGFQWANGKPAARSHCRISHYDHVWNETLKQLKDHQAKYGDCLVSYGHDTNLARWANLQRALRASGQLRRAREQLLDAIGFPWKIGKDFYKQELALQESLQAKAASENACRQEATPAPPSNSPTVPLKQNIDGDNQNGPVQKPSHKVTPEHTPPKAPPANILPLAQTKVFRPPHPNDVGAKVKKYFDPYGWFAGEIVAIDKESWHVRYEDDDKESYVENEFHELAVIAKNVELVRYSVGTEVLKHFPSFGLFFGKIEQVGQFHYRIHYQDGDLEVIPFDQQQEVDTIVENAKKKDLRKQAVTLYPINTVVAKWCNEQGWFFGKIDSIEPGIYVIQYNNGCKEKLPLNSKTMPAMLENGKYWKWEAGNFAPQLGQKKSYRTSRKNQPKVA